MSEVLLPLTEVETTELRLKAEMAIKHVEANERLPGQWMHVHEEGEEEPHYVAVHPGPGSHIGLRYVAECISEDEPIAAFMACASPEMVLRLLQQVQTLETRRAYGSDIINDMTAEAHDAAAQLVATEASWKDLRIITAGLRRTANYALDLWEGEDGPLSEEDQLEVRKLLFEISNTTWPIPGITAEQPAALVYPDELTPELDEVLGWPNFKCGSYAQAFRAAGHVIPAKAEREQAFIIHWLIKLVLRHGVNWHEVGGEELKALVPAAAQEGGESK